MGQLVVRNLDNEVIRALKQRAAQNNRSAEAEHREILRQALLHVSRPSFKEFLNQIPGGMTDEDLKRSRSLDRAVEL